MRNASLRSGELAAEIDRLRAQRDASRTPRARAGLRRFEGAVVDRLTSSWVATNVAIDQELRRDLDRLRARSRDLFKNNEHGAKFGRMVRNGIVGPQGFTLQAQAADPNGNIDAPANKAIEVAFAKWSRKQNCDVAGRRNFVQHVRGAVTSLARDGEFLFKKVRGAGMYGFQLQAINVDRLDTYLNIAPANGRNAIVMGVEIDAVRRPIAYHVWTSVPGNGTESQRKRERIPAADIIHGFIPFEEEQVRGVPWMHAAMRRLNDLNGYREAAVIAARVGAAKMGVWQTPDGGPPPGTTPELEGEGGEKGGATDYVTDATPGHFDFAPPGYQLHAFDPAYPHEQFDAFCKATLRGIAGAIGVSYNGLANDLEGVSYSSIRQGVLEERDEWMALQDFVVDELLVDVYESWLDMALLKGAITLPNGQPLPAQKRDKFAAHTWQGRRWQWVDPGKDIEAAITAINNGLSSPQIIAAQQGKNIEQIIDDLARFEQLLEAKGVKLPNRGKFDKGAASSTDAAAGDTSKSAAASGE
jgi:lambda family phage portal protein